MGKKIVRGSSYTKCNKLLAMAFEAAAHEIMAHFLRLKVTYYQHPSVTHATVTALPPPSPVSTLQSLPSITFTVSANTHSLQLLT